MTQKDAQNGAASPPAPSREYFSPESLNAYFTKTVPGRVTRGDEYVPAGRDIDLFRLVHAHIMTVALSLKSGNREFANFDLNSENPEQLSSIGGKLHAALYALESDHTISIYSGSPTGKQFARSDVAVPLEHFYYLIGESKENGRYLRELAATAHESLGLGPIPPRESLPALNASTPSSPPPPTALHR